MKSHGRCRPSPKGGSKTRHCRTHETVCPCGQTHLLTQKCCKCWPRQVRLNKKRVQETMRQRQEDEEREMHKAGRREKHKWRSEAKRARKERERRAREQQWQRYEEDLQD